MVISPSPEDVARRIHELVTLQPLGLDLPKVRRLDLALKREWGIELPDRAPAAFGHTLARLPRGELEEFIELNNFIADLNSSGQPIPPEVLKAWYGLLSGRQFSGLVSIRRTYILDVLAFALGLIEKLPITGPVLDVGCHTGYHAALLARHTGLSVTGVDFSDAAVHVAQWHRGDSPVDFSCLDYTSDPPLPSRYQLAIVADSFEEDATSLQRVIEWVAPALVGGGILLLAGCPDSMATTLGSALVENHLGFAASDITGGAMTVHGDYLRNPMIVLVKGARVPLPADVFKRCDKHWEGFRQYANSGKVPMDERNQAYYRARIPVPGAPGSQARDAAGDRKSGEPLSAFEGNC